MLALFDHGLFELAAVAIAVLVGRRFMLRRSIAITAGGLSVLLPIVLFFLATDEVQTWLLATLLASGMLNVGLILELAGGRRFHTAKQDASSVRAEPPIA